MQESLNKLREAAKDKDKEIELLYFDETGIANVPNVQRSWSPLGAPHSADATIARKRVNVLGALNYAAEDILHQWMVRDRFVLLFLPPYSPELNLIEILWKQAKYHWREFVTWAAKDLRKEVQALFDGFGTKFNFSYS